MISLKPAVLSVAALLGLSLTTSLKADQWNKKTVMTVKEAIQLPHTVLQPGTYVFKLADSLSDRHIVQIFNADETHIIATILAIPNYRLKPTGKSVFRFWETPAGNPKAMRAWFYPGDNFGQEFAYPKMKSIENRQGHPDSGTHGPRRDGSRRCRSPEDGARRDCHRKGRREAAGPDGPEHVVQSAPEAAYQRPEPPSAPDRPCPTRQFPPADRIGRIGFAGGIRTPGLPAQAQIWARCYRRS